MSQNVSPIWNTPIPTTSMNSGTRNEPIQNNPLFAGLPSNSGSGGYDAQFSPSPSPLSSSRQAQFSPSPSTLSSTGHVPQYSPSPSPFGFTASPSPYPNAAPPTHYPNQALSNPNGLQTLALPPPSGGLAEQIPETISKVLDEAENTYLYTKQLVMEKLGKVQVSKDDTVLPKVEKLFRIYAEFEELVSLSEQYYLNLGKYRETHKNLSLFFSEAASKELVPVLAKQMYEISELHHQLYEQGNELYNSIKQLYHVAHTFRGAAIMDCKLTCEKYQKARISYDVAKIRLENAEKKGDPNKIKKAEQVITDKKEDFLQLGVDLTTKVILLNEKRVQILSFHLQKYNEELKLYFKSTASVLLSKSPTNPAEFDVTTDEFKDIIESNTNPSLQKTPLNTSDSIFNGLMTDTDGSNM